MLSILWVLVLLSLDLADKYLFIQLQLEISLSRDSLLQHNLGHYLKSLKQMAKQQVTNHVNNLNRTVSSFYDQIVPVPFLNIPAILVRHAQDPLGDLNGFAVMSMKIAAYSYI